jgi:hypothetical protein
LANTQVLQDLGGTILRNLKSMQTNYSVALQRSDPRFGIEAALSDFDAQLFSATMFENNDRAINNQFLGGGTREFQQELLVHQTEIAKRAATGSLFAFRNIIEYDRNNAPGNFFPSAWQVLSEAEVRHPLLQGSGTKFNRLAGPFALPRLINGVLVARVNTDISEADFEVGLRDFISDVENAYWDLYFAYRDLNAKIAARDAALKTWRSVQASAGAERRGGEADRDALAREQYFCFQEDVQNALTGAQTDGTRTRNGTSGDTFRGQGGVQVCERRLRLLMGVPINDQRLIRPADEPLMAEVIYDWDLIAAEAIARRPELKKQQLRVQRAGMEVEANKNFLSPRLDTVGRYRFRGFGDNLLRQNTDRWNNAVGNLTTFDYQEWQAGLELTVPIGYRRAHAAVQTSELLFAKECALLREQERQVIHDLSNSLAEMQRAYVVSQTNLNRYQAAKQLVEALESLQEQDARVDLDRLLDAQRRLADAESRYFLSQAQYALAVKNVNFEKGSLLDFRELHVSDSSPDSSLATGHLTLMQSSAAYAAPSTKRPGATQPVSEERQTAKRSPSKDVRHVSRSTDWLSDAEEITRTAGRSTSLRVSDQRDVAPTAAETAATSGWSVENDGPDSVHQGSETSHAFQAAAESSQGLRKLKPGWWR